MRATYVRKIRTDAWTTHGAAGDTITHAMREIAALLGQRAAAVLGIVIQAKSVLDVDGEVAVALGHAQLIHHLHGMIQLTGPHGTGLVPVAMSAEQIAALNGYMGFPSNVIAGRPGGLIPAASYSAGDTAVESTLVLAYSERAFAASPVGHGSIYDGAIDTSLFGASTTLQITGIGNPIGAHVFKSTVMDIYVVYATCEPGQYLMPAKPQYRRLGSVQNDPQVYGLGQRSDLRAVVLSTQDVDDSDDNQNAIRASAAMMALELDGTELTEGPGRVISRCANTMGVGSVHTLSGASWEPKWLPLLSPCQVPQASERHVGSTVQLEGLNVLDASGYYPIANAYLVQAPDRASRDELARLRGIDPAKLNRRHLAGGKDADGAGLSADQSVGISPTVE